MPDLAKWLNWNGSGTPDEWTDSADRSAGIAFMLGRHGVSLVLYRDNVALPAQTVMVNPVGQGTTTQNVRGEAGMSGRDELMIVGAPGLDIKRNDQFALHAARRNYRVTFVIKNFEGMVQARAEALDNA